MVCAYTGPARSPLPLMLAGIVSLYDVDDVEAFVQATLNNSNIDFSGEERDELVLEGIAIMCDLAARYEPHRPGYQQAGRFSGYAAMFLPRRLGDAWHRLHPEHCYVTRPDGSREWVYLERAVSLDGIRSEDHQRGRGDTVDTRILDRTKWARPRARAA